MRNRILRRFIAASLVLSLAWLTPGWRHLTGHLQSGLFLTKFRKVFSREEMNEDLHIVQARVGNKEDTSEYTVSLPVSPP